MNLKYCASDQMVADIMTKPLTKDKLLNISNQIGLYTDNYRSNCRVGIATDTVMLLVLNKQLFLVNA